MYIICVCVCMYCRNNTFKTFLVLNPQLVNGGLFLHYYSKQRMLLDAEARSRSGYTPIVLYVLRTYAFFFLLHYHTYIRVCMWYSVLLPDVRPLPSILPDSMNRLRMSDGASSANKEGTVIASPHEPRAPLSDEGFLSGLQSGSLSGWGHDTKIRVIFLMLQLDIKLNNPRRSSNAILDALSAVEKEHFHLTITYFWIHMVSYNIAVVQKDHDIASISFDEFYRQPIVQKLRNHLLYDKYYSRKLLDDGAINSAKEYVLPDLKQLPSILRK